MPTRRQSLGSDSQYQDTTPRYWLVVMSAITSWFRGVGPVGGADPPGQPRQHRVDLNAGRSAEVWRVPPLPFVLRSQPLPVRRKVCGHPIPEQDPVALDPQHPGCWSHP